MISRFRLVLFVIPALLMLGATQASAQCATSAQAGPFCIDGNVFDANGNPDTFSGLAPGALKSIDGNGNSKELGPVNASNTKIGFIHGAPVPMLGLTNPNGQTDLNNVYTQTAKDGAGHIWFYFGWRRDSNSGSGFISLEAQKKASGCDYTSDATLANCNPWAKRDVGDFIILWDQSGNSLNIYLRTFDGTAFQPDPKNVVPLSGAFQKAAYTSDLFGGELAIDLTGLGLVPPGDCNLFANVIPGTVTGNSDTADYKDAVLKPISINPCGSFTVTKVTVGPDGKPFSDPDEPVFHYTVKKGGVSVVTSAAIKNGQTFPTLDQPAGTDYVLTEDTPLPTNYTLLSIACDLPASSNGNPFSVAQSNETHCTITNKRGPNSPQPTSIQTAKVRDQVTLSGILPGASDANAATIRIALFSDAACTNQVASFPIPAPLPYSGSTVTVNTYALDNGGTQVAAGTYYWAVSYSGDSFNNGLTIANTCGLEKVTVTFLPAQ